MSGIPTIQYIAGLFDGEGCISYRKEKHYGKQWKGVRGFGLRFRLRVAIFNNKPEVLIHIKNRFGGFVAERLRYGYKSYEWRAECKKAYIFLKTVYPYLFIKKQLAKLAIDFYEKWDLPFPHGKGRKLTQEWFDARMNFYELVKKMNAKHIVKNSINEWKRIE